MEAATTRDKKDEVLCTQNTISGKKCHKHYSFRTKREVLQATVDMSESDTARSQGAPRWTISD
ncbi:hypothetical protein L917_10178 [Phytophthora nicotianae]|uniref:Uncharacterized protein n=1 Tax=Phytophthora nicotianae TaxID=4792 RepID=W2L1M5_PHYNI|nr:hypothetical protein L917_10178 [Phytophthora nicotianae]